MGNLPFKKVSAQTTIIASVIVFMTLNAVLPLNFSPQAEATQYPFKLTITLEKTNYKPGEPVNITWILTNISPENITLYYSADYPLDFTVYDENFDWVFSYWYKWGTVDLYYPFKPIPPGGNWTLTEVWTQEYYMESLTGRRWSEKVPPGVYYMRGKFRSATYHLTLWTPPIRITIA